MSNATEELNFLSYFVLIDLHLNIQLMTSLLDSCSFRH